MSYESAQGLEHHDVRVLKQRALRAAFERFLEREWRGGSERGRDFQSYVSEQAWWLEDYSLGQLWEKNEIGGRPRPETTDGQTARSRRG